MYLVQCPRSFSVDTSQERFVSCLFWVASQFWLLTPFLSCTFEGEDETALERDHRCYDEAVLACEWKGRTKKFEELCNLPIRQIL